MTVLRVGSKRRLADPDASENGRKQLRPGCARGGHLPAATGCPQGGHGPSHLPRAPIRPASAPPSSLRDAREKSSEFMNRSSSDPVESSNRTKTLFVIDWDDTLFPTSAFEVEHDLQHGAANANAPPPTPTTTQSAASSYPGTLFRMGTNLVMQLFEVCRQTICGMGGSPQDCEFLVLTSSEPGWVSDCCTRYMPTLWSSYFESEVPIVHIERPNYIKLLWKIWDERLLRVKGKGHEVPEHVQLQYSPPATPQCHEEAGIHMKTSSLIQYLQSAADWKHFVEGTSDESKEESSCGSLLDDDDGNCSSESSVDVDSSATTPTSSSDDVDLPSEAPTSSETSPPLPGRPSRYQIISIGDSNCERIATLGLKRHLCDENAASLLVKSVKLVHKPSSVQWLGQLQSLVRFVPSITTSCQDFLDLSLVATP